MAIRPTYQRSGGAGLSGLAASLISQANQNLSRLDLGGRVNRIIDNFRRDRTDALLNQRLADGAQNADLQNLPGFLDRDRFMEAFRASRDDQFATAEEGRKVAQALRDQREFEDDLLTSAGERRLNRQRILESQSGVKRDNFQIELGQAELAELERSRLAGEKITRTRNKLGELIGDGDYSAIDQETLKALDPEQYDLGLLQAEVAPFLAQRKQDEAYQASEDLWNDSYQKHLDAYRESLPELKAAWKADKYSDAEIDRMATEREQEYRALAAGKAALDVPHMYEQVRKTHGALADNTRIGELEAERRSIARERAVNRINQDTATGKITTGYLQDATEGKLSGAFVDDNGQYRFSRSKSFATNNKYDKTDAKDFIVTQLGYDEEDAKEIARELDYNRNLIDYIVGKAANSETPVSASALKQVARDVKNQLKQKAKDLLEGEDSYTGTQAEPGDDLKAYRRNQANRNLNESAGNETPPLEDPLAGIPRFGSERRTAIDEQRRREAATRRGETLTEEEYAALDGDLSSRLLDNLTLPYWLSGTAANERVNLERARRDAKVALERELQRKARNG